MKIPQYNFLSGVVFNIQCIKLVIINLPKAINQVRDLKSKGLKQKKSSICPRKRMGGKFKNMKILKSKKCQL
jgi:hypothetical protein